VDYINLQYGFYKIPNIKIDLIWGLKKYGKYPLGFVNSQSKKKMKKYVVWIAIVLSIAIGITALVMSSITFNRTEDQKTVISTDRVSAFQTLTVGTRSSPIRRRFGALQNANFTFIDRGVLETDTLIVRTIQCTNCGNSSGSGSQGPAGPRGPKGDAGAIGPQGLKGEPGIQGSIGPKGEIGPIGPKGDLGIQGSKGDPGATGPKGDLGIQGSKGDLGATGPKGESGIQGSKGDLGATGFTGPIGPSGINGTNGTNGLNGTNFNPEPLNIVVSNGNMNGFNPYNIIPGKVIVTGNVSILPNQTWVENLNYIYQGFNDPEEMTFTNLEGSSNMAFSNNIVLKKLKFPSLKSWTNGIISGTEITSLSFPSLIESLPIISNNIKLV